MATHGALETGERDFFQLLAQAAFCNPFSEERSELDARIVGHPVEPYSEAHLGEFNEQVRARVKRLEDRNLGELRRYSAQDRELMQTVFLFELFHDYCPDFDRLIVAQVQAGPRSLPVEFAGDALARLRRRGIPAADAIRFFGIFYQLRRAYYFIARHLIGRSACMCAFKRHLWQNVFTREVRWYERYLWDRMEDFSTLLLGETGTGKGAAAAAIGRSGFIPFDERQGRFTESFMRGFVSLNLSQFPETLIESELFGHRKGAFTGAVEAHEGILARGSRCGAIFLDEIGEVTVPVQIKLLQVLQERTFCPVGSHEKVAFRGRVIAATNRPLAALRAGDVLRPDFYYRLCSDLIEVPPLRQRIADDPAELRLLLEHVVRGMLGDPDEELMSGIEAAIRRLTDSGHAWPGNVRELEQALRRILLTGEYHGGAQPGLSDLRDRLVAGIEAGTLNAETLLAGYCKLLHEANPSYEAIARKVNLNWRTVRKYVRSVD